MAPIKFEDNLKEKLEQRRLQSSTNAWVKLESKLETNETKNNHKPFWWFGIAASFVGVLIVVSVFFNKDVTQIEAPAIVDIEDAKTPNNLVQEVALEEIKVEKTSSKDKGNTLNNKPVLKVQSQQQNKLIKQHVEDIVVAGENMNEEGIKDKKNEVKVLTFEDVKLQEVVAQVQELKKNNKVVSDAEINVLLDQAQKEIALHKLYNESTKKVDANALLQDVEADLEQSFRDRAFKAIKSGYNYVKTTVAQRNN